MDVKFGRIVACLLDQLFSVYYKGECGAPGISLDRLAWRNERGNFYRLKRNVKDLLTVFARLSLDS